MKILKCVQKFGFLKKFIMFSLRLFPLQWSPNRSKMQKLWVIMIFRDIQAQVLPKSAAQVLQWEPQLTILYLWIKIKVLFNFSQSVKKIESWYPLLNIKKIIGKTNMKKIFLITPRFLEKLFGPPSTRTYILLHDSFLETEIPTDLIKLLSVPLKNCSVLR